MLKNNLAIAVSEVELRVRLCNMANKFAMDGDVITPNHDYTIRAIAEWVTANCEAEQIAQLVEALTSAGAQDGPPNCRGRPRTGGTMSSSARANRNIDHTKGGDPAQDAARMAFHKIAQDYASRVGIDPCRQPAPAHTRSHHPPRRLHLPSDSLTPTEFGYFDMACETEIEARAQLGVAIDERKKLEEWREALPAKRDEYYSKVSMMEAEFEESARIAHDMFTKSEVGLMVAERTPQTHSKAKERLDLAKRRLAA